MRENTGSVTPPRTSNKPQLKTCSYALIVFLSGTRLSFIPAPRYSFSCSVTCNGETNALFIPPVGDTNTSFPVTWHRGNRKLGQMGDWLEQLMQTLKLAPTKHSLFVKKRWNTQRKLWCTNVCVPDSWCLGNKVKEWNRRVRWAAAAADMMFLDVPHTQTNKQHFKNIHRFRCKMLWCSNCVMFGLFQILS